MTSGCFPGVSRLYQLSKLKTCTQLSLERSGNSYLSLGVVAVSRVLPKGTFVNRFDMGNFQISEHRHALADIYLGAFTLNIEQLKEVV